MRIITLFFMIMSCGVNLFGQENKKEIFAHYMGCFPIGTGPIVYHRSTVAQKYKHNSKKYVDAMGGYFIDWPLISPNLKLTPYTSAELEIKRAIRGGIDGFSVDAWAGGEGAKRTLDLLFRVVEDKKLPFKITICLDPNCLSGDKNNHSNKIESFANAIKYLLSKHGESPNLAKREGKLLIFGYYSRGIISTPEMASLSEGPKKWNKISDAFKKVEELVGEPIFFHFCIGAFFSRSLGQKHDYIALARWAGKNFPAVGSFLDTDFLKDEPEIAKAVKASGAEWSQPVWPQYDNRRGSLNIGNGFDILRKCWEMARKYNSNLIQFVTWNDYGEDTILSPGYNTKYTVLELNKYFIDWWKKSNPPKTKKDKIFLSFRKYGKGCKTFPFRERRYQPGVLEVVTILTKPGEIILPKRNIRYTASAGLYFKQFSLKIGKVEVELQRKSQRVMSLTARESITDKPFRPDNSMVCFSTEFAKNWELDFPDTKPFYYSEYSDIDKDGLPDWFEMYWFGKFLDFSTATIADPSADPDQDGLTNLQEYYAQSNPTKAKAIYQVGDVWDMSTIYKKNASFNPDLDFKETPVWYYLYKHGYKGKIPRDGKYFLCPHSCNKRTYAGPLSHHSPYKDSKYKYIHGWICRTKSKNSDYKLVFRPRKQVILILGWESPLNATISITGEVQPMSTGDGMTLEISKGIKNLYKKIYNVNEGGTFSINNILVQKNDFIYFIADSIPGNDAYQKLILNYLKIKLIKKE